MSQISVNHMTFYYEGSYDNIFENVSFQIDTDWKLGFIARNGKGKTTFLKLLTGMYEFKGSISSSVVFDYFPFEIQDKNKNTIDVIEEIYPDYEFWKICRELNLMNVDGEIFYRSFSTLSSGEQTKVMLALLFSKDNHFLLIDEPTNHLDMEARETLKKYLNNKKGFILVSHDRNFMDGCVDHVLVINKETIEVQQGNFSSWWENKKRQDAYELAENERLKKDIRRLTESARVTKQWADNVEATKIGEKSNKYEKCIDTRAYVGEKSRRMQMRRKNLERRQQREIDEKSGLLKNLETVEDLKILPLKHYKEKLVVMEDCTIAYPDSQQENNIDDTKKKIICGFNLEVRQGERIFLKGKNGCGKSSIIKTILKQVYKKNNENVESFKHLIKDVPILEKGNIEVPNQMIVSYCSQDTSMLHGTVKDYASENGIDGTLFMALLRKLDFPRIQFEKNIENYSGGQKKKILIAGSLCKKAHLYIWDEPLNFIDVFSRMQIEELILKFKPTMILVEHDKAFLKKVATKVVEL
ncbi:ATP-binding cassette domain-containing protein [Parablautia muri]|uniref:ABC transporter ATP-binding protein n=1 Tax=Parablautia muri TaxID=2320879 RepID=A0A9X5BC59_9FIRM|nr:ATP-binding cassette domain-containing protein [Parablautia muri]NBJ91011.1 ABC transporter ATP-binding protein [Parablautia muri]